LNPYLPAQVEDVESKLPPKVPVVVKVAPSPYQSCIYSWIKASGACTKSSRLFYWINTLVGMTHQSHLLLDQGLGCAA